MASSRDLLRRARHALDDSGCPLLEEARAVRFQGFAGGAEWMRSALAFLRKEPVPMVAHSWNWLGMVKYGLASAGAFVCAVAAVALGNLWLLLAIVPIFYAIEAQWVFLFPVALDGSPHPWTESRRWTVRAGGTLQVMAIVLPLAAVMLTGGWLGGGFVRSWCLGCLAICLWYEDLRCGV